MFDRVVGRSWPLIIVGAVALAATFALARRARARLAGARPSGQWRLAPRSGVPRRAAVAVGFEIGIHNSTLAITIALSPALLNSTTMAIPAAVYIVVVFVTAALFGWLVTLGRATVPAEVAAVPD
jgi:predicted Na+-dependent transporter